MVTDLGTKSSSKVVANKVSNTFAIFGLPHRVRFDGGPHFRGEFIELLENCNIPCTPSSPYNPESNGLAERHVGLAKTLLKKCLAAKEDYMVAISAMNATIRETGFSPAEMFLKRRIRTHLPDIRGQPDLKMASQRVGERDQKERTIMRRNKAKPALEVGEIVLLREETGSKKGNFITECEVISRRDHGKSYFVRDIKNGAVYLRARNKLRPLKEADPGNIAVRRLEHFSIEMAETKLVGILKEGKHKTRKRKGLSFDGTCHVQQARVLMALESP